jgi:glutaredoxin-like YruB-family protein
MNIKVYSTPTCGYCVKVKEYLKSKNIDFTDFNVSADREKAMEMVKLSGQRGVPVIVIDEEVIVGFDKNKIDAHINK